MAVEQRGVTESGALDAATKGYVDTRPSTGTGSIVRDNGATLTAPTIAVYDNAITFYDNGDATKTGQFDLGLLSTATLRTLQFPNANGVIALQMTPTAVKTANYTAAAGELVVMDATAGALVVTLPTTPVNGTVIAVKRNDTVIANTVTVNCGGSDVFNKTGGSASQTIPFSNYAVTFQYASGIWYQTANAMPIGQLDGRYVSIGGRINPRIGGTTSSTTPTANADTQDQYNLTAQTTAMTFGAPTGSPVDGQKLMYRVYTAAAQTTAFNSVFRALGVTLPTTTVAGKVLYIGTIYNTADTKWDVVAVGQQA